MRAKEKLGGTVEAARPYVQRIARDEDLHDHVRNAYESARRIYDDLFGDRGTTGIAVRVARDKDLQEELKTTVQQLREAGKRVQGKESHSGRNLSLLLLGITLGVLFNPATGPDTRRWLKDKIFGSEEPLEYQPSQS